MVAKQFLFTPYTLHLTPYTLHLIPYTTSLYMSDAYMNYRTEGLLKLIALGMG
jgi:hypothetical protein